MVSKSAVTHLQAILLIDLIVVSCAAAGYFYVSTLPGPELSSSDVQLAGLQVTPVTALPNEPINVLFNVTNVAGESGKYVANLVLDGQISQTQIFQLGDGETKQVQFTISGASEGTHIVTVGSLETSFTINSQLEYSNLAFNRTQAAINEPIGITLTVANKATSTTSYSLTLTINGAQVQTKTGQVNGETSTTVLFEVSEPAEGTYQVQVGGLSGSFQVNPEAPPAKPAEFQVSNLAVNPSVVQKGASATITASVTNIGELSGSYTATLTVNDQTVGSKDLQLAGGETVTVSFTVSESATGSYNIKIGDASTTLLVQEPAKFEFSNFVVSPIEVWGGQTVKVSVRATNTGSVVAGYEFNLKVDGVLLQSQTMQFAPGSFLTPSFSFIAPALQGGNIAHHTIDLSGLKGSYDVVKDGYHTLSVDITPNGDADFNLILPSGVTEVRTTPYSALLPVGTYTVVMPLTDPTGKVSFEYWTDNRGTSLTRQANLQSRVDFVARYSGGSSCPSLFMWNGAGYTYVSDVSNHGWLGYTKFVNSDGSLEYWRNNPWDYIPLNSSLLQANADGNYEIKLLQKWNEIFLMDSAYMLVVDHPASENVYSTMVEQYLDPEYMGQIYTVSKTPLTPVSAFNEVINVYNGAVVSYSGQTDALSQIASMDGVFTSGFNGKYSEAWNNQTWNRLTVDLGNLTGASEMKLVVRSIVDWGPAESYTLWMDKFYSTQVPDSTEPTPTPFLEVKDVNGNWIRVPESRQFPLPPDGVPRTFVVDLTGLFPTNDYSIRINNFWNVTFDYVAVDTSLPLNTTVIRIDGDANLSQEQVPENANSSGNFTRYGDVTELLLNEDDMFVIGRQGDAVTIEFSTANLTAPAAGMQRDYFFFIACWFKVEYANYGFGPGNNGFTVDPLPFHYMSGFPYPLATESYPYDAAHIAYLEEYNTRVILPAQSGP